MAKLWICDKEHTREPHPTIASTIWRIDHKHHKVAETLKALAAEIGRHEKLEELVLCYHGVGGGIIVGEEEYKLSEPEFAKAFAKTKTRIDTIRFEGCWVGEEPDEMAAFGALFGSRCVSGFTWSSWDSIITLHIPAHASADAMKQAIAPYEKWFVPGDPVMSRIAAKTKHGGNQPVSLLWYQYAWDTHPPYLDDNYKKLGAVSYKARGQATKRSVAAKDAKPSNSPHPPFEYVTVML